MIKIPSTPKVKPTKRNRVEQKIERGIIGKAPSKEGGRGKPSAPTPFWTQAPLNNKQPSRRKPKLG